MIESICRYRSIIIVSLLLPAYHSVKENKRNKCDATRRWGFIDYPSKGKVY